MFMMPPQKATKLKINKGVIPKSKMLNITREKVTEKGQPISMTLMLFPGTHHNFLKHMASK